VSIINGHAHFDHIAVEQRAIHFDWRESAPTARSAHHGCFLPWRGRRGNQSRNRSPSRESAAVLEERNLRESGHHFLKYLDLVSGRDQRDKPDRFFGG